jgi:predicted DNA-binding transcriptional regulator AlpA
MTSRSQLSSDSESARVERLLTARDAANLLRLSSSFLAKARMRGDGPPYIKLGRSVRYRESTLVQWMKSRIARKSHYPVKAAPPFVGCSKYKCERHSTTASDSGRLLS